MTKNSDATVYFDREKLCFIGLEDVYKQHLKETYVGVDVEKELKKMCLWLMSPKGKTRKGHIGFILNWLNNASAAEKVPSVTVPLDLFDTDSPLRSLLLDYVKDLWKGKEHILEFNKIRKPI